MAYIVACFESNVENGETEYLKSEVMKLSYNKLLDSSLISC